jgi:adenine deaminase
MDSFFIEGNLVDSLNRKILPVKLTVSGGKIAAVQSTGSLNINPSLPYILPGFIDAHVHIESSMLVPSEFARLAVVHGTVATVSDPHEIANVCGVEGVQFMIEDGKKDLPRP